MIGSNIATLLKRGVTEVIVEEEFAKLLAAGKPLRIKQGFDPSRPDIHLGHVVSLRKLRQFQDMDHRVILIVGDWTAQIGDPSGQSATRPMLSAEEVRENAQTYMEQFFKVVDPERTEVRWQSEWFANFDLSDVIKLTSNFTVAQFLAREDFRKRYESGRPIAITELLYPLLQAYDSVVVEADVEVGGTDQMFNCLVGRELQSTVGQSPQHVLLVPLLVGTDGRQKMSKSLENYIGVTEPPQVIYGKVLSIPDNIMIDYFELLTDVSDEELARFSGELQGGSVNPMVLKKRLARELVAQFHDVEAAGDAEAGFEQVFQRRQEPEDIPAEPITLEIQGPGQQAVTLIIDSTQQRVAGKRQEPQGTEQGVGYFVGTADMVHGLGLAGSKSEARRLQEQGAVEIDGQKAGDFFEFRYDLVIKVGKRRFKRLVKADA